MCRAHRARARPTWRSRVRSRGLGHDDDGGGAPAPTDELPGLADLDQASVTQRAGTGGPLRRVGVTMPPDPGTELGAKARREGGFDLHAGVAVRAADRDRLEHLCLLRPSLSDGRLTELPGGDLLLALRRRWSDGTSRLRLSPLELLAADAAWRPRIVPASAPRRPSAPARPSEACADRANHSWAELSRRGLRIDSLACPKECGGRLRFVATIERPAVVRKILRHLGLPDEPARVAPARGPPDEHQLGPAARRGAPSDPPPVTCALASAAAVRRGHATCQDALEQPRGRCVMLRSLGSRCAEDGSCQL